MREQYENKLSMFYAISNVCDNKPDLWCENVLFIEAYSNFKSKIPQIKHCLDILTVETLVSKSFKSIDRIEIEDFSLFLMGRILLLAKELANDDLYDEVRNYRNSINNCTNNEFERICRNLVLICQTYMIGLEAYAITPEEIAELNHLTASYSFHLNHAKAHFPQNKSTEEQLKKLFREAEGILKNELDQTIAMLKNNDPDFYESYKAARNITESRPNIYIELGKELMTLN